jgi:hypothetical protein
VREPPEPVDEAVGLGTSHQGGAAEEASWGVDQLERARARMRRGPGGGEGEPDREWRGRARGGWSLELVGRGGRWSGSGARRDQRAAAPAREAEETAAAAENTGCSIPTGGSAPLLTNQGFCSSQRS